MVALSRPRLRCGQARGARSRSNSSHRSPHPRRSGARPFPVRHSRPASSSMPPVTAGVADTQVAGTVVRVVQIERCALRDRPATAGTRRLPGSNEGLVPFSHRLVGRAIVAGPSRLERPPRSLLEAGPVPQAIGALGRPGRRPALADTLPTLPAHHFTLLRCSRSSSVAQLESAPIRTNVARLEYGEGKISGEGDRLEGWQLLR